ncbi:unnamed protein product [Cuscuta campestris]|uniref:Plant intracellular Ras-group-related LRR protein 6 n=1 Tax=Cuscuta campestris TaxID=132261 RepID=A0A484MNA3_9ASTE|nr:unnamed protein product [Cuscuta campestris]
MDRVLKTARTSGSLNLSNRSLREVPDEVYQSLDAVSGDEKWWEAVELQKMILAHNDIVTLKEDIRNLPLLSVLNVSHNQLSCLPAAIGDLQSLKLLDVSFNLIQSIPEEIGGAAALVKFDCSNNKLNDLPGSLGRCSNLAELKASNNSISRLPEEVANCTKLTKLEVEGNKLSVLSDSLFSSCLMLTELNASKNLLKGIPENIGNLKRLIRLDVHQNRISSIPSSIKECSSLLEFYIGGNVLSSLPAEIGELAGLGSLDLHSNQLKEFPVEACKLHLSVLDISNNSLSGLPPEIGLMTTLRKLLIVGNPMRSLRSSLVNGPTPALLKYLRSRLPTDEDSASNTPSKEDVISMARRMSLTSKEISLGKLGLTTIPSDVWEYNDITKVDLSENSIEELPMELTSCVSLEALILSKNKIKNWPGSILLSLSRLTCLKLDNNLLREIPLDGFQAVEKLQILDLTGNIGSLAQHAAFSCMPDLQELYLRRMLISIVPCDIMNLKHLRILDLSQNALQSIPEGIKDLNSLTELDLSDNNISTLPPELGLLEPSLQVLKIEGNPLRRRDEQYY